jgi:thiol-disulfide isomerase/thioredoxin
MKLKICLMGLLCLNFFANAQTTDNTKSLKNGGTLPYITLNNVVNWHSDKINLADYKGKVIIFDFWATWCTGCLLHFPIADSIQKEFGNQLQIILVDTKDTRDRQDKIVKTIRRFDQPGNKFSLPSVILDTLLGKMFWHQVIPHYVWIDQKGVVRATTAAEMLTRKNIHDFITTGAIPKYQKKDFDHNRPIYTSEDLPINRMLHFSMFVKGKTDGNGGAGERYINDTVRGIIMHDEFLRAMYATLFSNKYKVSMYDRYILETKHPEYFDYEHSDHKQTRLNWERQNIYSYELIVPHAELSHINDYALEDLNRYAPYRATVEKRAVKCWVLESNGNIDLFKTKGGAWIDNVNGKGHPTLQNASLTSIGNLINRLNANAPIIYRMDYKGPVDLDLKGDLTDMDNLAQQLQKYGIKLYQQVENIDMMIIRDK